MQKLLIVDHSEMRTDELTEALKAKWEIHATSNSYTVIDTVKYMQPDAMILNLNIGPKNGLEVLKNGFPNLPPVILALTNFTSPYIEQSAESWGVGSIVRLPCKIEYIADLINDMQYTHQEKPTIISRHLDAIGVRKNLSGYRCLLAAAPILRKDTTLMLKEVYPVIAKLCGLNDARCVERVIRSAIRDAWEKRDSEIWEYYFPGQTECPSNRAFIMRLIEFL